MLSEFINSRKKLGTLLLEQGLLSEEQVRWALEKQKETKKFLGQVLIDAGLIEERELVKVLALQFETSFIDLESKDFRLTKKIVSIVPFYLMCEYSLIPVKLEENCLWILVSDPFNRHGFEKVEMLTGYEVKLTLGMQNQIDNIIKNYAVHERKGIADIALSKITHLQEKRYGEALINMGLVTREQLESAREINSATNRYLGDILIDQHLISRSDMIGALESLPRVDFKSLTDFKPDPSIMKLVPEDVVLDHLILPVFLNDNVMTLAVYKDDATISNALDVVRIATGCTIKYVLADKGEIENALSYVFPQRFQALAPAPQVPVSPKVHSSSYFEAPQSGIKDSGPSTPQHMPPPQTPYPPQVGPMPVPHMAPGMIGDGHQIPQQVAPALVPPGLAPGISAPYGTYPAESASPGASMGAPGMMPPIIVAPPFVPQQAPPFVLPKKPKATFTAQDLDALKEEVDSSGKKMAIAESDKKYLDGLANDKMAPEFVGAMLELALKYKASDIHLENTSESMCIRLRIDGVLYELAHYPKTMGPPTIGRFKIMGDLDISEKFKAQDGNFRQEVNKNTVDFRICICPSIYGENAVIRILSQQSVGLDIEKLGFAHDQILAIKKNLRRSYGMILINGPTGSGKTTTLYSMLQYLISPAIKILTIEDPVEYRIPGITQMQVHINQKEPSKSFGFADGLKASLRSDPNIIMVGEVRDSNLANIVVQAALTGHLVFTTLHANNAVDVIGRLLNLEVDQQLLSASIKMIVSQRLLKNLCQSCREPVPEPKRFFDIIGEDFEKYKDSIFYRCRGCKSCSFKGFTGRIGVYEILEITESIRQLINSGASMVEIRSMARAEGMRLLTETCMEKVLDGQVSLEEYVSVYFDSE